MKQFRIFLTLLLVLGLGACSQESEKVLDLQKLNQELPLIAEDTFDLANVMTSVEYTKENIFGNLIDIYDYDYHTLGLSEENIVQGTVRISPTDAQMYMVFKPVVGKEEALKGELQNYLSHRILNCEKESDKKLLDNALLEENEDFIALIVSNNNKEVLNRILNSKSMVFGALTPIEETELVDYGLSLESVKEYAIQKPMLTSSRTYLIVKPKKGYEEEVKDALASYLKKQEVIFAHLPEELVYVENALVSELEGYQIVILSKNNDKVFEAIETYFK